MIIPPHEYVIKGILVNGLLSIGLSILVLGSVCIVDKIFRNEFRMIMRWINKRIRQGKPA